MFNKKKEELKQETLVEKIKRVNETIVNLLKEEGLTLMVEHVIKIYPSENKKEDQNGKS